MMNFRQQQGIKMIRALLAACTYSCIICEDHKVTIACSGNGDTHLNIAFANYGRRSNSTCRHPSPSKPSDNTDCKAVEKTIDKVKEDCQANVKCELRANNNKFGDTCQYTYKYLEVQFGCQSNESSTAASVYTTSTNSTTTTSTTRTTTTSSNTKRVTSLSSTLAIGKTTKSISGNDTDIVTTSNYSFETVSATGVLISSTTKRTNTSKILNSDDAGSGNTVTAVAVAISVGIIAGAVIIFIILFRRWKRKAKDDAVHKNGKTVVTKNEGDGFTNMTYSKETDNVTMQQNNQKFIDANSNSGDSGYTDMHNEDSRKGDNDYYMIKENRESSAIEDDQYYAIKDNVGSEYNRIAFKPKVIPDDVNYGHTVRPGPHKLTDETYDHAEGGGTLLHAQSREAVNEYSHLHVHEGNPNHVYRGNHNEAVDKDQKIPMTNKTSDGSLTAHDYFVLESENEPTADSKGVESHNYFVLEKREPKSDDAGATSGIDAESHDYFVLGKEEAVGDVNASNSVARPRDVDTHLKNAAHSETQNDVKDHTYFENPLSAECEDDLHLYQAMGQRVSNTCTEVEDTNHDYFVLEKEHT